jgi:translation initiation factor 1A
MTRNLTGGKNHKKAKQHSEKSAFIEKQDDQLYARIIEILGNRNLLAYCNDNKIRICHIRGSIRKDMWINIGDIVLVSLRDFLQEKDGKYEKADILFKYDRDYHSKLKKDNTINMKLFVELEKMDVNGINMVSSAKLTINNEEEDIFEESGSAKEVDSEESIDVDNI